MEFEISGRRKEGNKMEWQVVVALIIAIPIILFPVAFVWYLNLSGILALVRARARHAASEKEKKVSVEAKQGI